MFLTTIFLTIFLSDLFVFFCCCFFPPLNVNVTCYLQKSQDPILQCRDKMCLDVTAVPGITGHDGLHRTDVNVPTYLLLLITAVMVTTYRAVLMIMTEGLHGMFYLQSTGTC